VTNADHRGYVEFQFSLGDPSIFLEMMLPPGAFKEFCARHGARHLTPAEEVAVDAAENKWRNGGED
jgi:phenol hydroxylase P0 protein